MSKRMSFSEKNARRKQGAQEVRQGRREAKRLRRQRPSGAFGSCKPHIFNAMVVGTMGESRTDRGEDA